LYVDAIVYKNEKRALNCKQNNNKKQLLTPLCVLL